jgi:hypothetical protein
MDYEILFPGRFIKSVETSAARMSLLPLPR